MDRLHSLEPAVVVRGCAENDGLDEEGLVAVAFLVAPDDAEAPAARVAPPQHDLVAAVQVAERTAHKTCAHGISRQLCHRRFVHTRVQKVDVFL